MAAFRAPTLLGCTEFGSVGQTRALRLGVEDARGNQDGIVRNDAALANTVQGLTLFDRNPALRRLKDASEGFRTSRDDATQLREFVEQKRADWGQIVNPAFLAELPASSRARYEVQKASMIARANRAGSAHVEDHWVHAAGSVDGQNIKTRELAAMLLTPESGPVKAMVVMAPGYQETTRQYFDLAHQATLRGYAVMLFDPQWAGYSKGGQAGDIDRGFGNVRDVAAVAARAAEIGKDRFGLAPEDTLIAGNSMGGGLAGVVGAALANDHGLVHLEGAKMPEGLPYLSLSGFNRASPKGINTLMGLLGRIWPLNKMKMVSSGLPDVTGNRIVQAKLAQHASEDHTLTRTHAMVASQKDMDALMNRMESEPGFRPKGQGYFLMASEDPLADTAASKEVATLTGSEWVPFESPDHVHYEDPARQGDVLDGLDWLTRSSSPSRR